MQIHLTWSEIEGIKSRQRDALFVSERHLDCAGSYNLVRELYARAPNHYLSYAESSEDRVTFFMETVH